jgi:hypothetical protein
VLSLNEFLFEGFEGVVIQLELDLECPIRHALTLMEEGNHLIEDSVKVHRHPPVHAEVSTDPRLHTVTSGRPLLYVPQIAEKGKWEV